MNQSAQHGLPLDPLPGDMRGMAEVVTEYLVQFFCSLAERPVNGLPAKREAARRLRATPSEQGRDFASLFGEVREAIEHSYEYCSPGYLAYIPGGGLFTSALADFLAQGVNRYVGVSALSPAMVQIEENVLRWMASLFDFPAGARGILTTGGSLANFSAVATARHARLGEDFEDGTFYTTDQVHACVTKSARLAGLPHRAARMVPTDREWRMDVGALRDMVRADRAAGRRPFLVVASAGTTNTGAVDPLAGIGQVAVEEGLWLHVDAAYGGFFQLTARGRQRLAGIERADSITLDPHKGLFLPYGLGALLVRDGRALRAAHHEAADYLQDLGVAEELPHYNEYSPELSRDARGLRVWMPLVLHGVAAFRAALDEKLDLTDVLDAALREDARLELPWRPQLTVVPFRLAGGDDDANRRFLERINAARRIFCSSTLLDGRFTLRACLVVHRTHRDLIDAAIEIIRAAARE